MVKFHGKKSGSHNMTVLYPNSCYNEVCYTGTALYFNDMWRRLGHPKNNTTMKCTVSSSFSYNSLVKFHVKNGSHNMTALYPNLGYMGESFQDYS